MRRFVAEALVSLYGSRQINETDKKLILTHQSEIVTKHMDEEPACKDPGWIHTDIDGIEFPL
jgi:hypothetical protein